MSKKWGWKSCAARSIAVAAAAMLVTTAVTMPVFPAKADIVQEKATPANATPANAEEFDDLDDNEILDNEEDLVDDLEEDETENLDESLEEDEKGLRGILREVESQTSGSCGEHVTWKYDAETNVLTIRGTGAMNDIEVDDENGPDIPWGEYSDQIKTVEIEDGVTTIGDWAFFYCEALTSVTIPDSVKSIGNGAFGFCFALTEVTVPNKVTTIGDMAFVCCEALTSVTIPDSVKKIGYAAFNDCIALTEIVIPDKVESIGLYAFQCCEALETVTLGENVKTIGYAAFDGCIALTEIAIPDSVTSIEAFAFRDCALERVEIGKGIKTIGGGAFGGCQNLAEVIIKGNVKTIEQGAFAYCPELDSVIMEGETPAKLLNHYIDVVYFDELTGEVETEEAQLEYYDEDDRVLISIETDFVFGEAGFVTEGTKGIMVPYGKLNDYKDKWSEWADYMEELDNPSDNIEIKDGNINEDDIKFVLTEDELARLALGESVTISLEISDVSDSADETEKKAIQNNLGEYKEGVYLDIQLFKQFDGEDKKNVDETTGKVKVGFKLPETLINTNSAVTRVYKIIYVHNDVVDELECSFDPETGMVTFETDKFSLYSLVYKDTKIGTSSGGGSDSDDDSSSSQSSLPSYVVTGNWSMLADGTWTFMDRSGKSYQNEWAALYNPYAANGQEAYDWFRFDENKHMITGWFTDPVDGNIYYLNPISNGRLGSMYTGWQWIDRDGDGVFECYFFNPSSDGTRGRLICNTVTADGYVLNENGQWVVDGVVQTK